MPYIFGKLWHLAIIWAIRKAFQCILLGVRFLLANQTRLSPTSDSDSYGNGDDDDDDGDNGEDDDGAPQGGNDEDDDEAQGDNNDEDDDGAQGDRRTQQLALSLYCDGRLLQLIPISSSYSQHHQTQHDFVQSGPSKGKSFH